MKPVLFACLAVLLYSSQNVILEQKLAKYHTVTILVYFYIVMLPVTLGWIAGLKITKQPFVAPSGIAILIALGVGLVYFFADFFFVGAYTSGGSVFSVTTIVIMLPVFASVIKYFWVGGLPNLYQIAGYILAFFAVFLVTKGSV